MLDNLKRWLSAAFAAIVAGLLLALKIISGQRDKAREQAKRDSERADTAEKRIENRKQAYDASDQAKAEGDRRVKEAVDRARAGNRDHFTRGLRDD